MFKLFIIIIIFDMFLKVIYLVTAKVISGVPSYFQGKKVKIYFLRNGQHLAAIGAFMKGAEETIWMYQ